MRNRTTEALRLVRQADVNDLLGRNLDVLIDEFCVPFGRVTVRWDDATMTEPQPVAAESIATTFAIPVDGDALTLTYRSDSGAPIGGGLSGTVGDGQVLYTWMGPADVDPGALREWLKQRRRSVESFVVNNNNDVDRLNQRMRIEIGAAIEGRRKSELDRRGLAQRLPFPIARSPQATRPVPVQRKQVRLAPLPSKPTFEPEPAIEAAQYEDILRDCISMATVFERTPSIERMEEEEIRNLFLGMLNTNYTGHVAGELFNGVGKTDICIRVEDRNVFIGECKFYDGPASVTKAIDQVLGYLVWRDTKSALLLFVRGGNFTQAAQRAVQAVTTHPQCQHATVAEPTSRSDYVLTRADDPDRPIRLALLPLSLRA